VDPFDAKNDSSLRGRGFSDEDGNIVHWESAGSAVPNFACPPNSYYNRTNGERYYNSDGLAGSWVLQYIEKDLISLQALLDSDGLAISNNTFQSVVFNSVDIENDSATMDLNTANNRDVRIKKSSLYLVSYNTNFEQPNENKPDELEWRVTKNGSSIRKSERRFKVEHKDLWSIVGHDFLLEANANDVLNLQVKNNDNKDYELFNPITFYVIKLSNKTVSSGGGSSAISRSDLLQGGVAELIHTSSQNLTGTNAITVNWGASEVIDSNHYSFSGNEITFNKAGRYKVISKVNFDLNGGARTRVRNIWQHATSAGAFSNIEKSVSYCYMRSNNASDDGTCLSVFTYNVGVGDKIRLTAQNSANNSRTIADESNVILEFLGA